MLRLLIFVIFSFNVYGADQPESLLKVKPTEAKLFEVVTFKPKEGHHFNLKAPTQCGSHEFEEKTARQLRCQMKDAPQTAMTVSICDDAVTFCKVEKFKIAVEGKPTESASAGSAALTSPKEIDHPAPKGFITNEPARALELAKKSDQLLLIDFFGIWCPPCNMLDEYVFSTEKFQKAAKDIVKVRLDADASLSFDWKSHFKVGGYPTVIIADTKLREIGRLVGSRDVTTFVNWMNDQKVLKNVPVEVARTQTKSAKSMLRAGLWHFERKEYGDALKYLRGLKSPEAKKHLLLIEHEKAEDRDDKEAVVAVLQKLLYQFPKDAEVVSWTLDLWGLDQKKAQQVVSITKENLDYWKNNKEKLSDTGYDWGDLEYYRAVFIERTGNKEDAKTAYLSSARYYQELAERSPLKTPRGANMNVAYILYKAGKNKEAKELYEKLTSVYPEEFSFNYGFASVLNRLKEHDRALKYANKAVQHAYGDNYLRAVWLKAKIQIASNQATAAKAELVKTLSEIAVPKTTAVRTHRYISNLRSVLNDAEQALKKKPSES